MHGTGAQACLKRLGILRRILGKLSKYEIVCLLNGALDRIRKPTEQVREGFVLLKSCSSVVNKREVRSSLS